MRPGRLTLTESVRSLPGLAFVLSKLKDPAAFVKKVMSVYAQPSAASHDVIELLEPTYGASDRHDVGAGIRQGQRSGVADPARSAGDERNATGERRRHL